MDPFTQVSMCRVSVKKWAKASHTSIFITKFPMSPLLQAYCTHLLPHLRRCSFLPYRFSHQHTSFLSFSHAAGPSISKSYYSATPPHSTATTPDTASAFPPLLPYTQTLQTRECVAKLCSQMINSCRLSTRILHASPHFTNLKSRILTAADSIPQCLSDLIFCYSPPPPATMASHIPLTH